MRFAVRVSVVRLSPQCVLTDVEGHGEGPSIEDAASWAFARAFDAFARWEKRKREVSSMDVGK